MDKNLPKLNLELPEGDTREIKVWFLEKNGDEIRACISISDLDALEDQHAATDLLHNTVDNLKNSLYRIRQLTSGNYDGFEAKYYQRIISDIRAEVDKVIGY